LCDLAKLRESIVPSSDAVFLHAPFENWDAQIVPLSPLEQTIVELLPAERPLRLSQLFGPALRHAKKAALSVNPEKDVHKAIDCLAREGIIYCVADVAEPSRQPAV
jgi:hypothetical protein